MKPSLLIPPLAAIVLVVAWNGHQARSIAAVEKSGKLLRQRIRAAETAVDDPESVAVPRGRSFAAARGKPDWSTLANAIHEGPRSRTNLQAMLEFHRRLPRMSREEILAALDEIAALDLGKDAREALEVALAESLLKLDPQELLTRFSDRLGGNGGAMGGQLESAMRVWIQKDAAAALAWMDGRIAAGAFESKTLEGRNELRLGFEAALMESLIATDLQAAAGRLGQLPEDQRREVLERLPFTTLSDRERQGYVELVRHYIPQDEQAGSFAHIARQLAAGGVEAVSSFLDDVRATPDLRAAAMSEAAENQLRRLSEVDRGAVDRMREWLTRQAPAQADQITGEALAAAAQAGGALDYGVASRLVLDYQHRTGSDEVLIAFLNGYSARSNLEEARQLVQKVSDPELREKFLSELK